MNSVTIKEIEAKFNVNNIYARGVHSLVLGEYSIDNISKIISDRPKPFVKWVGGKRQLLKQFRDSNLYPPEGFNPLKNSFFEPFVGGGAVFFDLLPKNAYLSDMNCDLVTTYNVIKNDVEKLVKSLKKHQHNKKYFLEVRAQKVERKFLVLLRRFSLRKEHHYFIIFDCSFLRPHGDRGAPISAFGGNSKLCGFVHWSW